MSKTVFVPAPGWLLVRFEETEVTASGLYVPSSAAKSIIQALIQTAGYAPVAQSGASLEGYNFSSGEIVMARKASLVPLEDQDGLFLLRHNDVLGRFYEEEN